MNIENIVYVFAAVSILVSLYITFFALKDKF